MSFAAPIVNPMQQKRRAILRLLARSGGHASPGAIHAELGIAARTVSRTLKRLRAQGVISGTERRLHLTAAGWAAARPPRAISAERPALNSARSRVPPRRPLPRPRTTGPTVRVNPTGSASLVDAFALGLAAGAELLARRRQAPASLVPPQVSNVGPPAQAQDIKKRSLPSRGGWVVLETGQVVWRGRRS